MQEIVKNVYIEDQFPGVTVGVIIRSRGLVQIDAPPSMDDGRTWRASLMGLNSGPERILINLDPHPDRTLGVRAMDCTVIAHEKTAQVFRSRPTTFKAQGNETGADWESIPGMGSVRWAPPEVSFTDHMELNWGEGPILLESHPGPSSGAIWATLPEEKVVFVGDAVLKHQPPFLASSNITHWLESLETLLSANYKGYTVISSRGGVVTTAMIKAQMELMEFINDKLDKMTGKKLVPAATEKLVEKILSGFKAPAARQKQYGQRLRYGLQHYYARHYHSAHHEE